MTKFQIIAEPPRGNFRQEEFVLGEVHTYVTREKETVVLSVFDSVLRSTLLMSEEQFHQFVKGLVNVSAKLRE